MIKNGSSDSAEDIVRNVCANMSLEGFDVSKETRKKCYAIALGVCTADDLVKEFLDDYFRNYFVEE